MTPNDSTAADAKTISPPIIRKVDELLRTAQDKLIRLDAIDGLSRGYEEIGPIMLSMAGILPDQRALSPWAAKALVSLIPPILTPSGDEKFIVVFGLRQLVTVVSTTNIEKIQVKIVRDLSDQELSQFAYLEAVATTLQISVRPDGNGLGQLVDAFSKQSPIEDKTWLRKILPGVASKSEMKRLIGVSAPNGKKQGEEDRSSPGTEGSNDLSIRDTPLDSEVPDCDQPFFAEGPSDSSAPSEDNRREDLHAERENDGGDRAG